MLRIGIVTLCSVIFTACLCPFVLILVRRLKVNQPILGYVTNHYSKSGTPTMGGIAFLLGTCAVVILSNVGYSKTAVVATLGTLGFGILGFLDDFIKVKGGDNKGLSVIQKLFGQIFLSIILAYFAYVTPSIGSILKIPFLNVNVELGFFAVPIYAIFIVAVVNFVNLTDGLDGLVSTTGAIYFVAISIVILLSSLGDVLRQNDNIGLVSLALSLGGALSVFYVLNSYPAKIFMGDTGSLGIGAGIATVTLFSGNLLLFFILGITYVISGLSVVLQVFYFKLTKKRIFKMAPFHHHLEKSGMHENKIVALYSFITFCCGILVIFLWG